MPDPEPTGRERLLDGLRTPASRGQVLAAVLLALLGFAAAVQLRENDAEDDFAGARQADLVALIANLRSATQRAEAELEELEEARAQLRDRTEATGAALEVARQQAETFGILAGTLPATGPGVRITVEAGPGQVGTDQLLNGLQELRDAGAEAVEVDDEVRVVAQTALQDTADGGVRIDGADLAPPYVLDVIGDPTTLADAVDFTGGFASQVEQAGGRLEVEQLDRVEVTSVREPAEPRYARPAQDDG